MDVGTTIELLRARGLTYCARSGKLETLHRLISVVEARNVPGLFIEAGVAMGGSACVMAKAKHPARELMLFDVFELLPPPSERDGPDAMRVYEQFKRGQAPGQVNFNYLAHAGDLLSFTRENMKAMGVDVDAQKVHFIKGLYENTLRIDQPVAFAHIDCDWYDSVMVCINRISDFVSTGGIVLFDDYRSFDGCQRAVDAWLAADKRFRIIHNDWTVAVERI
jgi:hypothetical protein